MMMMVIVKMTVVQMRIQIKKCVQDIDGDDDCDDHGDGAGDDQDDNVAMLVWTWRVMILC